MLRFLLTPFVVVLCWLALCANADEGKDKAELEQIPNRPATNRELACLISPGMSERQVEQILGASLEEYSYGAGLEAYCDDGIKVYFDEHFKVVGGAWILINGKYVPANAS